MKRFMTALAAGVALMLVAGVSVASAGGLLAPALPPQQGNDSDQGQIQILPVAPQLNAQNVNVLTSGDVEQGNANNANTGQAAQQENTQYQQHTSSGPSQAGAQANDSDQHQVQIVPIAPQLNAQNVNVLTSGDVEQGNANNANTGQAAQQENTRVAGHPTHGSKPCGDKCKPRPEPKPEPKPCPSKHDGGCSAGQRNDSDQHQVQIVPIAPQLNLQNVNVLTFGDVEQGNANNANTGQATQQENTRVAGHPKHGSKPCGDKCKPRPEPKPCPPKDEAKPCPPKHEPKPCPPKDEAKPCPPKHEPKPCPPKHDGGSSAGQRNDSDQHQVQIVPIAPQLNLQNVNVLTFGDVEQGNANNANTGQAAQQSNRAGQLVTHAPKGGGPLPLT